jgi:anti-sigma-K factor RskA
MSDDMHLLAGAYALDALDDDEERDRFERHLSACDTCRNEVGEFRQAAASLASAVAETAPRGLRSSVLQAVDHTRQVSVLPSAAHSRARLWPIALAAALIALVGTLGFAVKAQQRADDFERIAAVTAAPDARSAPLVSANGSADTTLRITYSPSVGRSVVVGAGLPAAPDGKTYQLWYMTDGVPRAAAVFERGSNGALRTVLHDTPGDAQVVALTVEPDGGSPLPTSAPIFAATLAT